MAKLYNHCCGTCHKTYFAYDPDRLFCCSHCEAFYKNRGRCFKNAAAIKPMYEPKNVKVLREEKEVAPRKKVDLKDLMYRDTFKQYIPKSLKVMRG